MILREAVRTAFAEIMGDVRNHKPAVIYRGVLVDQMVTEGVELVIGATFSRQFGHAVMFGLGSLLRLPKSGLQAGSSVK